MSDLHFIEKKCKITENQPWEILVVDDDDDIHTITKSFLKRYSFQNKKIKFHHAYTVDDATDIMKSNGIASYDQVLRCTTNTR